MLVLSFPNPNPR